MSRSYFIDWCPRAIPGLDAEGYSLRTSGWREELSAHNAKLKFPLRPSDLRIADIFASHRLDGIFIFCLVWSEHHLPERDVEMNIANLVSHYLKTKIGHEHIYNKKATSVVRYEEWQHFVIYPVKLDERPFVLSPGTYQEARDLNSLLSDARGLFALKSYEFIAADGQARGPIRAIILLRARYSRLFDKTFRFISTLREAERFGIKLYGDTFFFVTLYLCVLLCFALLRASGLSDQAFAILVAGSIDTLASVVALSLTTKAISSLWVRWRASVLWAVSWAFTRRIRDWFYFRLGRHFNFLPGWRKIIVLLIFTGPFFLAGKGMLDLIEITKWLKVIVHNRLLGDYEQMRGNVDIWAPLGSPAKFSIVYLELLMSTAFAMCAFLYILQVSIKRRRILRVLRGLRGYLMFGSIMSVVTENICRSGGVPAESSHGFEHAVLIVNDRISLELKKRFRAQMILVPLFLVSSSYALGRWLAGT